MQPHERIGNLSMAAAVAMVTMAQAFHPSLLLAVHRGQTAAWLAVLASALLAGLFFLPTALALAGRRCNLTTLARTAGGGPGAMAAVAAIVAVLVLHTGFVIREIGEMAVSAVYPHTPQSFAMVSFTLAALYGSFVGTVGLVRLCRASLVPLVLAIGVALTGAFPWGQILYLSPFWGPGGTGLAAGAAHLMSGYMGLLFLMTVADRLEDRASVWRSGAIAILVGSVPVAAVLAVMLMVFPLPMAYRVTFPLHEMARLVMGGRFLERLEGLWLLFWVFSSAGHVAVLWHTAALSASQALGMQNGRWALPALATLAATVALFPADQGQVITWHLTSAPLVAAITFGLPLLLAAGAALRGRGKVARHGG